MNAIHFNKHGKIDSITVKEIAKPIPKGKDVLIKVKATSLSYVDCVMMSKVFRTPGAEAAGIVEAVGEKVTWFKPGDEVMAITKGMHGAWAEYVLANENSIAKKEPTQSFEEAATVSVAGITAWEAIKVARITYGQEVLIYGASGGVGQYILQLCKMKGAIVTAVCSTRNVEIAKQMGADYVVDYKKQNFTDTATTYDRIIAVNGNNPLYKYKKLLKSDGCYIGVGGVVQVMKSALCGWLQALGSKKKMGISVFFFANRPKSFIDLNTGIRNGMIQPYIDHVYNMGEIKEAITYALNEHPKGKVVIRME